MNTAKCVSSCVLLIGWSSAFAQTSSVTLYGIVDNNITYLDHQPGANHRSSSQWAMGSGGEFGSRFGLRGDENLGGGYAAVFDLEQGFNSANGSASDSTLAWKRQAYVGLRTPAGTLTFGRQYSAYYDVIDPFIPQNRSTTFEPYQMIMNDDVNNTVKYTGEYRGLTVVGLLGLGGVAGNYRASATYSLGVDYKTGPLLLGFAADQSNTAASTVDPIGSVGEVRRVAGAARYRYGKSIFYAGYKWQNTQSVAAVTTQRDAVYWAAAAYWFRPDLEAKLAYYYQDLLYQSSGNSANPEQLTMQVNYFLSKSTALYFAASHTWNSAMNFAAESTLAAGETGQFGGAIGFWHRF